MKKYIIINGIKSHFLIYSDGRVYSEKRNKFLSYRLHTGGYLQITLTLNGMAKDFYGHRLVATYFIPNPKNKPCVNHINGLKTDNRIENLEWVTDSENQKHSYANGLNSRHGENNGQSKFTKQQILEIRSMVGVKASSLAKTYGVAEGTIRDIVKYKTWVNVKVNE